MTTTASPAAERTGAIRSGPAHARRRRLLPLLLLPLILLLLATSIGYLLFRDPAAEKSENVSSQNATSVTAGAGPEALPPSPAPSAPAAAAGAAAPPVTGGGAAATGAAPAAAAVGLVGGGGMAAKPATGGLAAEKASGTILFATGSARLDPAAMQVVEDAATRLKAQKVSGVSVTGYTDNVGSVPRNVALSERRAVAVAAALDSMLPDGMVMTTGKGWSDPAAPNDSTENRMMNRRVTIVGT